MSIRLPNATDLDAPTSSSSKGERCRGKQVALVLGAGGHVGHAFHAGVLRALHDALDWDARAADLIVGTSAGASVGALIRAGMAPEGLVSRLTGDPLQEGDAAIAQHYFRPTEPPEGSKRRLRPSSGSYFAKGLRRPWKLRPGPAVAALLPEGRVCLKPQASGFQRMFGHDWPDEALWITAVHLATGRVVAFGRDGSPRTDVGTAVTCSSAVPAVCKAVLVEGERYVDGGMVSATNLPLLTDEPSLHTVLVSSPLSRMPLMSTRLRREIRILERAGLDVIAFEPRGRTIEAMGWNPLDPARSPAVARAAYEQTLEDLDCKYKRRSFLERV